jgi:hypothetical protein
MVAQPSMPNCHMSTRVVRPTPVGFREHLIPHLDEPFLIQLTSALHALSAV